eukprot:4878397-Pyramimonas_sp.AAC.1
MQARVAHPVMGRARRRSARSGQSSKREGEDEAGCGMIGAACMRRGKCRRARKQACHALDAEERSRKLVRRSFFGSELFAACGAAVGLQAHFLALGEMARGPTSAEEIRRLRGEGGCQIPADIAIDG